tara:strand:- start:603 stop:1589 length:987 start_codon:yes stop_codon:yes gene_type:complete
MFCDLFTPFVEYDRFSGIGASEVASIMGCGFNSSIALAQSKKSRTEKVFGAGTLVRFDRGHREERIASEIFRDERARGVERLMKVGTLRHPDYPWAYCSPDRLIVHRRTGDWLSGLEIKHTDPWNSPLWGKGEDMLVPEKYEWQCRYTLWIVNAALAAKGFDAIDTWWLMPRIGFFDDRYYPITWNLVEETKMVEAVESFWEECVLGDKIPDPNGHPDDLRELKAIYPEETEEEYIEAPEEMNEIVPRLHTVKSDLKSLNKESKSLEAKIVKTVGDHAGMYGDGWTVHFKAKPYGEGKRRTLKIEMGEKVDVERETTSILQSEDGKAV